MLQIENLVFNAWGRRFFDQATVTLAGGRQGRARRPQRRRQVHPVQAHPRRHHTPDGGDISLPKSARIGSVDQEHPATPVSLLDTVLAADVERERAQRSARDRRARADGRDLRAADRDRRRRRARARERNPERARLFNRRSGASDGRVLRRLAHARRARRRPVRASRTCCCSTSRPTISTSKARCGSRRG